MIYWVVCWWGVRSQSILTTNFRWLHPSEHALYWPDPNQHALNWANSQHALNRPDPPEHASLRHHPVPLQQSSRWKPSWRSSNYAPVASPAPPTPAIQPSASARWFVPGQSLRRTAGWLPGNMQGLYTSQDSRLSSRISRSRTCENLCKTIVLKYIHTT